MGKTKIKELEETIVTPAEEQVDSVILGIPSLSKETPESDSGQAPNRDGSGRASMTEEKKVKKSKKPGKARGRGKKYQEALKLVDRTQKYPLPEAIKLAQETSYSKFTGTLEAHINTSSKNLRGLASLPYLSGKSLRILAFGKGGRVAGADVEGTDEDIAEIDKGKINFDVLITTPEWMPKLAKIARILGPRSLMPNPKSGTITDNLEKTITELRTGKIEYKTEPNGQVIHLAIGKTDQAPDEVAANIKALYNTLGKSRVKKLTLSPTIGPGVKVDLRSLA
ncbi:MAG: 50S ribosomal protein L1 [Candidatus Daviesbacteria bacterium GW2011_GWA2_42_7]|uniref:Large ribosomal subunit protein uL1 n=2 Tax=Candidatus Daviesiibacteriota TaxID=1752718 RepID=A0A0G1BA32_9BACT|nr:MAG: 50S ribosomal protein L1 [Candidatus Daviesbacteria bacterium GW2011_GWA2_42_7]